MFRPSFFAAMTTMLEPLAEPTWFFFALFEQAKVDAEYFFNVIVLRVWLLIKLIQKLLSMGADLGR